MLRCGKIRHADNTRRPPGEGNLEWGALLSAFREIGYDGCLTSEFVLPIAFQPPPDYAAALGGALVGRVFDAQDRGPLARAGICLREERRATLALAYDGYRLAGLPAGRREIQVSARGYAPARRSVVIRPGATDTLDFRLERCPSCVLTRCFEFPTRGAP